MHNLPVIGGTDMNAYQDRAALLRSLAHPARLRLLDLLVRGPACVCDLVMALRRRQPYVSQHLSALREAGLVVANPEGRNVWYRITNRELVNFLQELHSITSVHLTDPLQVYLGDRTMMANQNQAWHGIPRASINWYPTIVEDYCVGCGLCVTSCGRNVYAFDYEGRKPVVVDPLMCMVGCTTCATLCPQDAVDFPSRGFIRNLVKKNKLLRQSKDLLQEHRGKYGVAPRAAPAG
jgi:DNA-binding transcriptional ArsR family regulator/NAD-dependent dihydropyrimidine dehydrogenase PreA subunit